MKTYLVAFFLCTGMAAAFGQPNPDKARQVVLHHNKIGKMYAFDHSQKGYHNRIEITYLGKLQTRGGHNYKILISRWYWGLSPRATSRIVVFNHLNQYLGNYYVTMTYDLPIKIEGNALIFDNKERDDCDPKIVTKISFVNGLPKQFFLECKNKMGDIYSFGDE